MAVHIYHLPLCRHNIVITVAQLVLDIMGRLEGAVLAYYNREGILALYIYIEGVARIVLHPSGCDWPQCHLKVHPLLPHRVGPTICIHSRSTVPGSMPSIEAGDHPFPARGHNTSRNPRMGAGSRDPPRPGICKIYHQWPSPRLSHWFQQGMPAPLSSCQHDLSPPAPSRDIRLYSQRMFVGADVGSIPPLLQSPRATGEPVRGNSKGPPDREVALDYGPIIPPGTQCQ